MEQDDTLTTLITQAQRGDRNAFARLVELHYDLIFRIAYKWCGHRDDAQDIAQDVCIKLARAIAGYAFQSAFKSWLYRMVINTAKDMKRKDKPMDDIMDHEHEIAGGEASPDEAHYAAQVLRAVSALPDNEKTAILLVAAEGLSHKEAATVMDCKESTVSWYIHEGRKKLDAMKDSIKEGGRRHG